MYNTRGIVLIWSFIYFTVHSFIWTLFYLKLMFAAEISDDASNLIQYWKQWKFQVWLETWLRQEIQALTQV